jgi:hypothetical protein
LILAIGLLTLYAPTNILATQPENRMSSFREIVFTALERAINRASTMTIFITLLAFAVTALFLPLSTAALIALAALAVSGIIELSHFAARRALKERLQAAIPAQAPIHIASPLVTEERVRYEGAMFVITKTLLGQRVHISAPLCPQCGAALLQEAHVHFPARTRIVHHCVCGYSHTSAHTLAELHARIAQ